MILKVENIFFDCLYKEHELIDGKPIVDPITVEGIHTNFGFNPNSIERNKERIKELVLNLHPMFHNGWSFLNLCLDKNEDLWTGEHRTMEKLMVLAIAAGYMKYCLPKKDWNAFPQNMPYIIITI